MTTTPSAAAGATVAVVVPTYLRPDLLRGCLAGLARQERPADEVIVVRREDDLASAQVVAEAPLAVREVLVHEPGVLAALHAGARSATSDVIAFTDDDAVPQPAWLATLLAHYADPAVGGVGGRDHMHPTTDDPEHPATDVGRIGPWGKAYGFHHVGVGAPVQVDVLKGVNMSFRAGALALPARLRGKGAQVHNELATALWARAQGWRLVYDPAAQVDHYMGPRFDDDRRHRPDPVAVRDEAANLVQVLLTFRPELFWRRAAFGLLVGDRATPGLLRGAVALARRQPATLRRLGPSLAGQLEALRAARAGARLEMVPVR